MALDAADLSCYAPAHLISCLGERCHSAQKFSQSLSQTGES